MAGATGLEPATSGVTGQRSNQLSYTPAVSVALVLSNQPTEVNCITDFKHLKAKPINYAGSPVSRRVEWKGIYLSLWHFSMVKPFSFASLTKIPPRKA